MKKKLHRIYILSFLFSLHLAISAYVNSTFLSSIIGEHFVGLIYTVAAFVTLVLLSNTGGILKYLGNKRLTLLLLICNMIGLLGLIKSQDATIVSISFVIFIVTNYLVFYCLDIFIEHFGTPASIGRTRGIYLTFLNIGWLLSPLITSYLIANEGGYIAIYVMAFFAVCIIVLGLLLGIGKFNDKSYEKKPFLEMYKFIKKNRHIRAIVIINFILQFFFSSMVVYTPIYLNQHIGLGWDKLGIIFTIMLLPFVLFGIPIGKLIDNYHIHKRTLLTIGTVIISIATISIGFIGSTSIALWAFILFMTRFGAVMLETVSEIYFFTHVREEDASTLSIFRDMTPLAYIIGPLLGTLFLSFFQFKYLFLTLGLLMLSSLYYIKLLKHTKKFYESNRID
jgi:hypothetical protein